MKIYRGERFDSGCEVYVHENGACYPLPPRNDIVNHSPNGFEWGYAGSGPAQLALAILAEHLENDGLAEEHYQAFKWAVIVGLPREGWTLTSDDIEPVLAKLHSLL